MTQRRSRRFRRPARVPTFQALAAADGAEVTELLREVSEFRLALDTDLTIAAAAADAAAEQIAPAEFSDELTRETLDAGRSALEELRTRRRLGVAEVHPGPAPRALRSAEIHQTPIAVATRRGARSRRRPADRRSAGRRLRGIPLVGVGPLVGVAVVLSLGTGFVASNLHHRSQSEGLTNAAATSLHSLSSALGQGNEQAAREAGNQLSAAIGSLIAAAPSDPAAAQAAASALSAEQMLLASTGGALGVQLRASMSAQVVALQTTVHSPISTLVTPRPHAATPGRLGDPLTLPSKLPSLSGVIASLPVRLAPSHRVLPTHLPTPSGVLASLVPTASPSAVFAAPSQPAAAAASPTAAPGASSPSPSATPTTSTSSTPNTNPLPLGTNSDGSFGLGH